MFAQNDPASLIFGQLEDRTSGMKATSGGSSDTEEKVPTTIPSVVPSGCFAVIRVTPVGYCPSTYRNQAGSSARFSIGSTAATVVSLMGLLLKGSCRASIRWAVAGSGVDVFQQ